MMRRKRSPIDCIVKGNARGGVKGKTGNLKEVSRIEPLKKLLASGLSGNGMEQLDIRGSMSQSLQECARTEDESRVQSQQTLAAVNSTMKRIADQIHDLEIQIQMMNLRKKALKRRSRILDRLAESFEDHQEPRRAA